MLIVTALATTGYLNLVWLLHKERSHARLPIFLVSLITVVAHAIQLFLSFDSAVMSISVTHTLTLVAFCMSSIGAAIYFIRGDRIPYAVVSLLASAIVWTPFVFPALTTVTHTWGLKVHIVLSLSAYIAISFAALYACLFLFQDGRLKKGNGGVNLSLPLNEIERFMITSMGIGELLLTCAIVTGIVFIRDLSEQHIALKVFFSIVAWVLIVIILFRHFKNGFRGRSAAIWLLWGFSSLLIAYFGSAFILLLVFNS